MAKPLFDRRKDRITTSRGEAVYRASGLLLQVRKGMSVISMLVGRLSLTSTNLS
jgi:hypothetical protein